MSRRLRRPAALAVPLLLVVGLVVGCGSDDGDNHLTGAKEYQDLAGVTVTGEPGSAPEIEWKGTMLAEEATSKTLTEGDGAELAEGDSVWINYVVADGYTHKVAASSYDDDGTGILITVGTEATPTSQNPSIGDFVQWFVSTQVEAGLTQGSRLAVAVNATQAFGQGVFYPGVAQADIGNDDGLLFVIDVVPTLQDPDGAQQQPQASFPRMTFKDGDPTGFNFDGVPAPSGRLRTEILKKGAGEVVKKGDTIIVNYLGQTYRGKKPFDGSYGRGAFATSIGTGAVVEGWDEAIVGQKVGTRMVIEIPPAKGYKDQKQAGIPANSTLYFVVDILGIGNSAPAE